MAIAEDILAREKRRASRRRPSLSIDKEEVIQTIIERKSADITSRGEWMTMRLERYAKYRGWSATKTWPWDNCANVHIPIMMIDSQRLQDTLHNAVMAIRPPMNAKAEQKYNVMKQETVDALIDYQVFVEHRPKGEEVIGHIIEKYVNDGLFTTYIPWVRETQRVHDVRVLPPLDDEEDDRSQLSKIAAGGIFDNVVSQNPLDEDGFNWDVIFIDSEGREQKAKIAFYFQENGRIEAHIDMPIDAYNGPAILVKSIEDVIHPWRCGNLQMPGPSNPHGAPHVYLLDYPRLDEIKRLKKEGFYDLLSNKDMDGLETWARDAVMGTETEEPKEQKDSFEGIEAKGPGTDKKTLTRIMAFERWDVNGDGLEEDVIFWILEEPKKILRARLLTEMFPASPPRRPFAEAQFIPTGEDRRYGISLLELVEPIYDVIVTTFDQIIDNGTLTNTPFGFYRPGSGMKPGIMHFWPGEFYPLSDPKNDIHIPTFGNQNQTLGFNLLAILQQYKEQATMQGEIRFGRVPHGKASALRNVGSMMAILQQSDARPERILRRFFIGLSEVWAQIHELNQRFLPAQKKFRIVGVKRENENPYKVINDVNEIGGRFTFDWQAALMNTNPDMILQSLMAIGSATFSPLSFQLKLATPKNVYNWLRDLWKAAKFDPDRYIQEPTPDANIPRMLAEEVLSAIMDNQLPDVLPLEDPRLHLQKIQEITQTDAYGLFSDDQQELLKKHIRKMVEVARMAEQQAQLMQAAFAFQDQLQGGRGGNGTIGVVEGAGGGPPVQGGELIDETLPGAGGGANA